MKLNKTKKHAKIIPILTSKDFTLKAVAQGAENPPPINTPGVLHNGDFCVEANRRNRKGDMTGDGVEEHTWWTFDFRKQAQWQKIAIINKLTTANLVLKLRPGGGFQNDELYWLWGNRVSSSMPIKNQFSSCIQGQFQTVAINLLSYWTPEEIVHLLMTNPVGTMSFEYADDALISHAEITLSGKAYRS